MEKAKPVLLPRDTDIDKNNQFFIYKSFRISYICFHFCGTVLKTMGVSWHLQSSLSLPMNVDANVDAKWSPLGKTSIKFWYSHLITGQIFEAAFWFVWATSTCQNRLLVEPNHSR